MGLGKIDKWQTAVSSVVYTHVRCFGIEWTSHMYIGKAKAVVVVINCIPYLLKHHIHLSHAIYNVYT